MPPDCRRSRAAKLKKNNDKLSIWAQLDIIIYEDDIYSDVDPHWSYADPQNLVNADPDPGQ